MLNPQDFQTYLHSIHLPPSSSVSYVPYPQSLSTIVGSPLEYHPDTYHIPGYPANPRMLLSRLYHQLGVFLDYYTGEFEEGGLSAHLRKALGYGNDATAEDTNPPADDHLRSLIPPTSLDLFPQFGMTEKWPPTIVVHGTHDSAVPIEESRHLARKLTAAGVAVQVCEVEEKEHSFDYEPGAEELFGGVFDAVVDFLNTHLSRKGGNSGRD